MYALGLMIYEMNYGQLPESCMDPAQKSSTKSRREPEHKFNGIEITGSKAKTVMLLCKNLLNPDPKNRWSAKRALRFARQWKGARSPNISGGCLDIDDESR